MRKLLILAAILFLLAAAVMGARTWREHTRRQAEEEAYRELAQAVTLTEPETGTQEEGEPEEASALTTEIPEDLVEPSEIPDPDSASPLPTHKHDFDALQRENEDCVGWIRIEDTEVDYPVMYTPEEPQRYLHRAFSGEYGFSGVPFLDCRSGLFIGNRIIHGHAMKNGTMFGDLKSYLKKDYLEEHPLLEFETADGCESYAVFAVVKTTWEDPWYSFLDAASEEKYGEAIGRLMAEATQTTKTIPVYGDRLLTLSTCYGRSGSGGRLLIVAKEVRPTWEEQSTCESPGSSPGESAGN